MSDILKPAKGVEHLNGAHLRERDVDCVLCRAIDERDALRARVAGMRQALQQACNLLDESTDPGVRLASMSIRGFIGARADGHTDACDSREGHCVCGTAEVTP